MSNQSDIIDEVHQVRVKSATGCAPAQGHVLCPRSRGLCGTSFTRSDAVRWGILLCLRVLCSTSLPVSLHSSGLSTM